MTDKTKNILIGLFVLSALCIMVSLVLFLKPSIGDGKKILSVRFTNITGISTGTRVTFAGKPIGEVIQIKELPNAREIKDPLGRIYMYELTLKIDSSVDVYNTDEVAIKTTGLMGEKSIAILPKASMTDDPPKLITDQVVYANSTDALENTFNQVTKVAVRLEKAISRLDGWFLENESALSGSIQSLEAVLGGVDGLLASLDGEKMVPTLKNSLDLLNDNMQVIKESLTNDQLLHKLASLTDNLDTATTAFNQDAAPALRNLNLISRDLASGSGTIGRLITGDDFYLRLASLMNKGETLMNDINHYGLLFQYNKKWQKTRTKKANFLKALDTPQEFRNYFEGEVDSMTTSIGRLSELMDRAGSDERNKIVQSDAFKHSFANLMRQVQGLTDSLKLYNEGLIADSEMAN